MFGLFYLAWFGLMLALVGLIISHAIRFARHPDARRKTVGKLLMLVAAFLAVTWPFLLGRGVFYTQCRYAAGLKIERPVDLRNDGYRIIIDPPMTRSPYGRDAGHFYGHQATQDLLTGRIEFFERAFCCYKTFDNREKGTVYQRLRIGNKGQRQCVNEATADALLQGLELPAGKCLTWSESLYTKVRYHLIVKQPATAITLLDSKTGETVAQFRSFSHWSGWVADAGSEEYHCPLPAEYLGNAPQRALTAFVLPDRRGERVTLGELRDWYPKLIKSKLYWHGVFPELPPRDSALQQNHPDEAY